MKALKILVSISICLYCFSITSAMALRFEFDNEDEIADWELGPNTTATIADGMLQLEVKGGLDSGIYLGDPDWTDYRMEVRARKVSGPYFHLFARVVEPTKDFYFMEISYNSDTTSLFVFQGGVGADITPGGRPARPESKDQDGGDAYTLVIEAEGDTLRTFIDGELMVEQNDGTFESGKLGLGARDSVILYEYVDVEGVGIPPTAAVDAEGKLTATWGRLKSQ